MKKVILCALQFLILLSVTKTAAAQTTAYVPGQIIVSITVQDPDLRRSVLSSCNARELPDMELPGFLSIAAVPPGTEQRTAARLRKQPLVRYAEPNYILQAYLTPDDEYYSLQWHFSMLNVEAAWDVSTGSGVTVAVVDTGVRAGNDGFDDRVLDGYNAFLRSPVRWEDNNLHGTHVAGTIAQATNNGTGVAGVAFSADILPVKVLDSTGFGTVLSVARGIVWAVDNGADIINLSLGGSRWSWFLKQAVDYAYDNNVTVIAASGNEYGSAVGFPAAFETTIAVGAIARSGALAEYSNIGPELDLVAPGGDTTQDIDGDGNPDGVLQETFERRFTLGGSSFWQYDWNYYFLQGTSMATPHVSGVAALLKSIHADWGPDEIREALISTATDLGAAGRDDSYGYGLVDAFEAVQYP